MDGNPVFVFHHDGGRLHLTVQRTRLDIPSCDRMIITLQDDAPSLSTSPTVLSQPLRVLTMDANPQRSKDQDGVTSALDEAIEALNLAEKRTSAAAAKAVFETVSAFLATIRV